MPTKSKRAIATFINVIGKQGDKNPLVGGTKMVHSAVMNWKLGSLYALIGLICAVGLLWGLAWVATWPTVAEEKRLTFADDLVLSYRITNEGGALGQVRYEVFAEGVEGRDKIFEGVSGERFLISNPRPDLIRIRFCNGQIERVSKISRGADKPIIVVQPDLAC